MEDIFCNVCKNILRKTEGYDICYSCSTIEYKTNYTKREFVYIRAKILGFLALKLLNQKLLIKSLGLSNSDDLLQYILEKREFYPNHIFETSNTRLKTKYANQIISMMKNPSTPNEFHTKTDIDGISSGLTELKVILYGSEGRSVDVDPTKQGEHKHIFNESRSMIQHFMSKINSEYDSLIYCDSCDLLGEKDVMSSNGEIHPYDGCTFCY